MQKLLFLFFILPAVGFAQFDSLGIHTKWRDGTIVVDVDTKLKGFIRHNDKMGLVKFKERLSDDVEEISFHERNIMSMEYYDSDISQYRKFALLKVKDDDSGFQGAIFFEIIMELKAFSVLSKKHSVNPAFRARQFDTGNGSFTYLKKVGYEQFELICLVGSDAEIKVLSVTNNFAKNKTSPFAEKRKPYFKASLMKKYLGPKWKQVNSFVKSNRLKLKRRADLIRALEYYAQLESGEVN